MPPPVGSEKRESTSPLVRVIQTRVATGLKHLVQLAGIVDTRQDHGNAVEKTRYRFFASAPVSDQSRSTLDRSGCCLKRFGGIKRGLLWAFQSRAQTSSICVDVGGGYTAKKANAREIQRNGEVWLCRCARRHSCARVDFERVFSWCCR
jgi:hypothetical protein